MFTLSNTKIRRIQKEDLELILAWRNSDRVRQNMFQNEIITWEEHVAWFEKLQRREDQVVVIVFLADMPVGVVSFTRINCKEGFCEWGFYIGNVEAPKGSGMAMGILALDFAFETIGMRRIVGQCFVSNHASANYHVKLGFFYQGILNEIVERNGLVCKIKQYELTIESWRKNRSQLYVKLFI